ncbi:heparinase II/III family protein [Flexibacterium corallicola]|uniref:heparinase II/III family protein n=1 Tax=Flexibacterium corallicola TaxID=3037259 RepID=UPI00286ECB70|nr:heparinase II/III family protein [Pseudovibrio sp. M1P-2-3]
MTLAVVAEQVRIGRLLARSVLDSALNFVSRGSVSWVTSWKQAAPRLLIAPQDLRTTDSTNAADIYAGRFIFSGTLVEAHGNSPFEVQPPTEEWAKALHGFSWLRHLKAAETAVAKNNARALVEDWIKACGGWHTVGWKQEVVARRILSWITQSPLLLEGCDADFYKLFMRSLARQVRFLHQSLNETADGVPRLIAAIAIASAYVCMEDQRKNVRHALRRLDQELERQILPDGGHISRHPGAILDILVELLPLRQALMMQGQVVSKAIMESIDRMMPMVRFFRHGDGSFAHFNGMSSTQGDIVATILAYDDARGMPPAGARHSGYQRLTGGSSVALVETGGIPAAAVSEKFHAGCLSFEFSSGRNRIVVNCGVSGLERAQWRSVARSTAAHSTVEVAKQSSCRFLANTNLVGVIGTPTISGPRAVNVERKDGELEDKVIASHDGYAAKCGVIHEREITLSRDGTVLDGIDRLKTTHKMGLQQTYAIRFHLHPSIQCRELGNIVYLKCEDGEIWEFSAENTAVELSESIYLSDVYGHRRSTQIVIPGVVKSDTAITWMLRKASSTESLNQAL